MCVFHEHLSHGDGAFGVNYLPAKSQERRVLLKSVLKVQMQPGFWFFLMEEAPASDSCLYFNTVVFQPAKIPLVP